MTCVIGKGFSFISWGLRYHLELGELQQQLLCSNVMELHCCLGVLTTSLNVYHITNTETVVLNDIANR